jgi:hypothetical protein
VFWAAPLGLAQTASPPAQVQPQVLVRAVSDGKVTVVYAAPKYSTAIRMNEPVNSVVVGDPAAFSAEHSEQEPNIVFVKPITAKPAQTNLLITTTRGHQASILVISRGEQKTAEQPPVDFLLRYQPAGRFLIQQADVPSGTVAETAALTDSVANGAQPATPAPSARNPLDELLDRQRKAPLPALFGAKPGMSEPGKELVRTGIGEVVDQGREVVVLFSVVNPQSHGIELMPPQIQLGGMMRSGRLFKKSKWNTSEQLVIVDYRMSRRRLGPGERADGVVVFDRPPYKQSNESLFLQIAESGAVDRPALAPVGFGVSSFDSKEEGHNATRKPSGKE